MKKTVDKRKIISCMLLCGILLGELGSPMQARADEIVVEKESLSIEGTESKEMTDG